jgi:uncharacterized SAM-binding protein YcdF (DUF218 family)
MLAAVFILLLAVGAIVAGSGYSRLARRMRTFRSAPGRVFARDVVLVPGGSTRTGALGDGGGYMPHVRYRYTVDGVELESDKTSFANQGWKRAVAELKLLAIPDDVVVWYDPNKPGEAYLVRHTPTLGYLFIGCGILAALCSLSYIAATLFG